MNPFGVTGQHTIDPFAAWNARQQVAIRANRDREWREAELERLEMARRLS